MSSFKNNAREKSVMPVEKDRRSSLYSGWYIVAASFVILFFNAGARFAISVMFKPLIAEFGWSRGTLSLAFFLNMTVYAISLIFVGRFYDRYGPKWVLIISTLFLSAGFMSIFLVTSLWQFFICYGVLAAIGMGGTAVNFLAAVTSKWFKKRRGLAVSLALSGSCIGQFALVPLFTIFVYRIGWRASYFWIGCIMFLVNIILAVLVIKGDPEPGVTSPSAKASRKNGDGNREQVSLHACLRDLDLWEAMRTRSFWMFCAVMFVCGSGDFLMTTHWIAYTTDHGISPTTAGNMLAWFGLMSLVGILVAGTASDRIGNRIPLAITFALRVIMFLLILRVENAVSFYIFALVFGFTFFITAPLTPTLIGRLFGLTHIGLIGGAVTTIHHLGGGLWAYVGGVIFDHTGSYHWAFGISMLMAGAAVLCALLIKEERHEP
ncbi:MAG: MFS transporter [Deltaproteobacteria bacterium]|nr:MFS transporter [Deltaproteobacteria bacterium]